MRIYTLAQTDEFSDWVRSLKDRVARVKIFVRAKRLADGNMGDVKHLDGISNPGKTMSTKISLFDVADYLDSEEDIAAYLNEVLAEDDQDLLLSALDDIARARGMTEVADAAGVTRPGLYKALKPGAKTGFMTVRKVVSALGLKMMFVPNRAEGVTSRATNVKPVKPTKMRAAAAASKAKRAVRRAKDA